jgi:hypothetical protein
VIAAESLFAQLKEKYSFSLVLVEGVVGEYFLKCANCTNIGDATLSVKT